MTEHWPAPGTLLAHRYRLLTRIEVGGMAAVWRARDELLGRPVALKLLADRYVDEGLHHLVHREARAAARLSHPHVAAVHDYAEAVAPDGTVRPFVVMELLGGESLAARLTRGPLPWPEAAAIGAATADALAAAHGQGVVHRDIAPGNVMLTPGGVKVVDFGISAAIGEPDDDATGATFGTPAYVAPERLDGLPAQAATDVYALGVLLYEMVTGAPPHPADTWEDLPTVRATAPAPLPSGVPAPFADMTWRCLAEAPEERPGAGDVAAALRALAVSDVEVPAQAPPGSPKRTLPQARPTVDLSVRPDPAVRRNLLIAACAVVVAVAVLVAFNVANRPARQRAGGPGTVPSAPISTAPAPTRSAAPPPSPVPTRPPALALDVAVDNLRRSVDDGRAAGDIRPDVAQDLLNLINNLDQGGGTAGVNDLHRKVDVRSREGGISRTRAAQLHAELNDIANARP